MKRYYRYTTQLQSKTRYFSPVVTVFFVISLPLPLPVLPSFLSNPQRRHLYKRNAGREMNHGAHLQISAQGPPNRSNLKCDWSITHVRQTSNFVVWPYGFVCYTVTCLCMVVQLNYPSCALQVYTACYDTAKDQVTAFRIGS